MKDVDKLIAEATETLADLIVRSERALDGDAMGKKLEHLVDLAGAADTLEQLFNATRYAFLITLDTVHPRVLREQFRAILANPNTPARAALEELVKVKRAQP